MVLLADSEDPDQTVRMRRLIWAFAVRICQDQFCVVCKVCHQRTKDKEFSAINVYAIKCGSL